MGEQREDLKERILAGEATAGDDKDEAKEEEKEEDKEEEKDDDEDAQNEVVKLALLSLNNDLSADRTAKLQTLLRILRLESDQSESSIKVQIIEGKS